MPSFGRAIAPPPFTDSGDAMVDQFGEMADELL
jgi:hypothetical protein